MSGWTTSLTLAAALGAAVVTGVFFVFSAFGMRSLGRLPAAQGVTAMQTINVDVPRPPFLVPFVGTAVAGIVLVVHGLLWFDGPSDALTIAGVVLYLLGPFGITMLYSVPRNNALARLDPQTRDASEYWLRYQREWGRSNNVRTVVGMVSLALLIGALQAA